MIRSAALPASCGAPAVCQGHDAFQRVSVGRLLRQRLKTKVVQRDFEAALEKGCAWRRARVRYLPGWCGPLSET